MLRSCRPCRGSAQHDGTKPHGCRHGLQTDRPCRGLLRNLRGRRRFRWLVARSHSAAFGRNQESSRGEKKSIVIVHRRLPLRRSLRRCNHEMSRETGQRCVKNLRAQRRNRWLVVKSRRCDCKARQDRSSVVACDPVAPLLSRSGVGASGPLL